MSKNNSKATEKTETALAKPEAPAPAPSAALVKAAEIVALVTSADYFADPIAPDTGKKEEKTGGVPYIGFRGTKSTARIEELTAAGVKPLDLYLNDGEVLKVQPFSFYPLKAATFYTEQNNKMRITRAEFEAPPFGTPTKLRKYIVGVGVVRIPQPGKPPAFVPAGFQFRGGQCKCVERPLDLVEAAKNVEAFAARSDKHKVASLAKIAGGRVIASVWMTSQESKYANDEGETFDFNLGHNTVSYPDAAEVAAFNEWFDASIKEPGGKLVRVLAQFEARVNWLRRVARKEIDPLAQNDEQGQ